jgi:thiol:disulfide interchange protein DsbC
MSRRSSSRWPATIAALLAAAAVCAEPAPPALLRSLHERFPEMTIDQVRETAIPGVFEAVAGDTVFYVDATGRYALKGTLVDLQEHVNLTLMTKAALKPIAPSELPLADAFTIVHGNGRRQLYLFEDPDCPYCKRLERETLAKVGNVTLHVFLFPIVSLHPDAYRKAVSVWCADDRQHAWEGVMLRDEAPDEAPDERACDSPVRRNVALAERLGIDATPTLVFDDGKVVPGVISTEQIEALLGPGPR